MPPSRNRHSAQRVFTWDKIKMALAAAEEGFYIWNIKTGVIHYTDRCLTMMGASRKEKAPNIFRTALSSLTKTTSLLSLIHI